MTDPERPERDERPNPRSDAAVVVVAVTVTRTGGFAGLRRTWSAQPDRAEAPRWIALLDGCPWDSAAPTRTVPRSGADRFEWFVDAKYGDAEREAALADPEVQGPWRELIDAVRAATKATPGAGSRTSTPR